MSYDADQKIEVRFNSISNFEAYMIHYFGENEFRKHLDCENCSKKASIFASK